MSEEDKLAAWSDIEAIMQPRLSDEVDNLRRQLQGAEVEIANWTETCRKMAESRKNIRDLLVQSERNLQDAKDEIRTLRSQIELKAKTDNVPDPALAAFQKKVMEELGDEDPCLSVGGLAVDMGWPVNPRLPDEVAYIPALAGELLEACRRGVRGFERMEEKGEHLSSRFGRDAETEADLQFMKNVLAKFYGD